jgi:hypothetical protein
LVSEAGIALFLGHLFVEDPARARINDDRGEFLDVDNRRAMNDALFLLLARGIGRRR